MGSFRYPLLDEKAIVSYITNEFPIETRVATEQLNIPTEAFFLKVLDHFLIAFGFENYQQVTLNQHTPENIGIYQKALVSVHVYQYVGQILAECNFSHWYFCDIEHPKRDKVKIVLSQLIGLHEDLCASNQCMQNLEREYSKIADKRNEQLRQIENLKNRIEEKTIFLSENKENSKNGHKECERLCFLVEEERKQARNLADTLQELRMRTAQLRELKTSLEVQLAEHQEKYFEKEKEIVESPEKIFQAVKEKEHEHLTKRTDRQRLEKEIINLTNRYNLFVDLATKITQYLPNFKEILVVDFTLNSNRMESGKVRETALNEEHSLACENDIYNKKLLKKKESEKEYQECRILLEKQIDDLKASIKAKQDALKNIADEKQAKELEEYALLENLFKKIDELSALKKKRITQFGVLEERVLNKLDEIRSPSIKRIQQMREIVQINEKPPRPIIQGEITTFLKPF